MTFPHHLRACQTNAAEDTGLLSIQQQVCSHGDRIEVERWSASLMISFHPEQTLSLSITNLILLYCSISTLLPTSMVTSNEMRPHPVQRKCILLQINILIACMLQYRLFNIAFFAPILTDTDRLAIVCMLW